MILILLIACCDKYVSHLSNVMRVRKISWLSCRCRLSEKFNLLSKTRTFPYFLPSIYYIMYQYIRLVTTYSHQLSRFSTNWDFPRLSTNTYSSRFYKNTLPNKKLNFSLMSLLTFVKTSINTSCCVYTRRTLETTEVEDVSSARTSSNVYNRCSIKRLIVVYISNTNFIHCSSILLSPLSLKITGSTKNKYKLEAIMLRGFYVIPWILI